jgi:putative transposase
LVGKIAERLSKLLHKRASELEMTIHALEVMPDHIHLFVEFNPRWGVAELVNRFKGFTTCVLREEFPTLRSKIPTLWSCSYYAGTVGHVSEKTVRACIESQQGK